MSVVSNYFMYLSILSSLSLYQVAITGFLYLETGLDYLTPSNRKKLVYGTERMESGRMFTVIDRLLELLPKRSCRSKRTCTCQTYQEEERRRRNKKMIQRRSNRVTGFKKYDEEEDEDEAALSSHFSHKILNPSSFML